MKELRAQGLFRQQACLESIQGTRITLQGKVLDNWCSNDYLGLSQHPKVVAAAITAVKSSGVGARASRLLSGTTHWHRQLEEGLAAWFNAEEAIVYPSGYQANAGALGALLAAGDVVFVDRLAHASLLDAARSTAAAFKVFRHNDVEQLRQLLSRTKARRRFIVTEGVFSMDGDASPLADLVAVADAHDAIVYLDDAHGAFVCGKTGRGSLETSHLASDRLIYMATLGKALGCQGGFLVGSKTFVDHLRNKSRAFIYSTALATPIAAAALAALQVVRQEPQRRLMVSENSKTIHQALRAMKLRTSEAPSHILPVILGNSGKAVAFSRKLFNRGIWSAAIRPPTVPEGSTRLRLGVTAGHTHQQVARLIKALEAASRES